MTCFQCGKKGVKTGHVDCKQKDEPNAAGEKAKAAIGRNSWKTNKKMKTDQGKQKERDMLCLSV